MHVLNRQRLADQSHELSGRLDTLEARAHELAGEAFNLGSPKQLGHILFEKLELPVLKKTPKGAPSTAEDVLTELALDYPLPRRAYGIQELVQAEVHLYRQTS